MSEELLQKFLDALQPVANKLGEGAEFIYEAAVLQVMISGVLNLVWAVVLLGLAAVIAKFGWSLWTDEKWLNKNGGPFFEPELGGFALGLISLFPLIIGLIQATVAVPKLLNPHWYAVGELLNQVGIG